MSSITFRGKTINYRNERTLANKLNISPIDALDFVSGKHSQVIIRNRKTGNFGKLELESANLNEVLKDFGIKKLRNEDLFKKITLKRGTNKIEIGDKVIKDGFIRDVQLKITLNLIVYDVETLRTFTVIFSGDVKDLDQRIYDEVKNYEQLLVRNIGRINVNSKINIEDVQVISLFTNQEFEYDFDNNTLADEHPIDMTHIIANIDLNKGKRCVDRMTRKYTSLEFDFDDEVSRNDIIKKIGNKIGLRILSQNLNVLYDNTKNHKEVLTFIDAFGHCYPALSGKTIHKRRIKEQLQIEYVNCTDKIIELLENKKYPHDIQINYKSKTGKEILSFICEHTKYISNPEHSKILHYLKNLKITGKDANIPDGAQLKIIFSKLERKYEMKVSSFFPVEYTKGAFNYCGKQGGKVVCIDKNKAYSCSLYNLPYLLNCDYRTCKIDIRPENIYEDRLYIAEPIGELTVRQRLLMAGRCFYWGKLIIKAYENGINIKIYEEVTCDKHQNKYKDIINDLLAVIGQDNDDFKDIMNKSIGTFAEEMKISKGTNVEGIFLKRELGVYSGNRIPINNKFSVLVTVDEEQTLRKIYNKKPINVQIKDNCNMQIFDKIIELGISDNDIVHIKTDAIAYRGKLPKGLDENDFNGWKKIDYKPMLECGYENYDNNPKTCFIKNDNINELHNCNAGWGKTWTIKNKLIKNRDDYNILTPSHKTCETYIKDELNACVIQKYEYSHSIPKSKTIIIDEIGLMNKSSHDVIFKCFKLGKEIIAYGDFNQLSCVDEDGNSEIYFNSPQYISMLFGKVFNTFQNHRNNFSEEYYNDLINEKIDFIEEVAKYVCEKPEDAEIILCHRNTTADKYNEIIMKHKGLKHDSIGLRVICRTNMLRHKQIYNGFAFMITDKDSCGITLDDKFRITMKQYDRYFKPYYASTLYGYQGLEAESIYFAPEDGMFIKSGRYAYTIISRLKQQIKEREYFELDFS